VLRNPAAESIGISSNGAYWTLGASSYNHAIEQSFYGWIGETRIVARALAPSEFLLAR
jgi:hypothetical protein